MSSLDEINALVDEINIAAGSYSTKVSTSQDLNTAATTSRLDLLRAAKALVAKLEDPEDEVHRFVLQPCALVCLISAWKCGILDQWPKEKMSLRELSLKVNADQKLVVRMMRALVVYDIFKEVEEEIYEHSSLSLKLSTPPLRDSALPRGARALSGIPNLLEYLSRTSYKNPGDDPSAETFFQFTNNTELSFFEWIRTQPRILSSFDSYQASTIGTERVRTGKGLADIYPFEDLGKDLSSPHQVVLVDVGGGYGQVLEDIQKYVPGLVGKMVLEDLPETVEAHVPLENVEIVPYNFITTEQPVKGARAYLLRHILHDWPDHSCRQILLNTITALVEGESRILVVEKILPPLNAPVLSSLLDIRMMYYGGCERKEKHWRDLFGSVGLEVVKIWPGLENDSMMELRLKSG